MNIAPYIKLYKDNRISTRTIEKELANHIVNIFHLGQFVI